MLSSIELTSGVEVWRQCAACERASAKQSGFKTHFVNKQNRRRSAATELCSSSVFVLKEVHSSACSKESAHSREKHGKYTENSAFRQLQLQRTLGPDLVQTSCFCGFAKAKPEVQARRTPPPDRPQLDGPICEHSLCSRSGSISDVINRERGDFLKCVFTVYRSVYTQSLILD